MESTTDIIMMRCDNCRKLLLNIHIKKTGSCRCGCRMFRGASPANIIERMQEIWWNLTVRI